MLESLADHGQNQESHGNTQLGFNTIDGVRHGSTRTYFFCLAFDEVSMLVLIKVLFQNGVDIERHRTICLLGQPI